MKVRKISLSYFHSFLVLYIFEQINATGLLCDIEIGNVLHHPCLAGSLIHMEIHESTSIAAEIYLIFRFRLFAHLNIHDGRTILCHAPVIRLMAVVVHALKCHFLSYLRLCDIGRVISYRVLRLRFCRLALWHIRFRVLLA